MLRCFALARDKVITLVPVLRSFSVNLPKFDKNARRGLFEKLRPIVVNSRNSSGKTMVVKQSDFSNSKYYDELHFFVVLGVLPYLVGSFLINLFVGQAELAETPDDYEPRYWEYYRHPITRFIARNLLYSPQQVYENNLAQRKLAMDTAAMVAEDKWFQESELRHQDYRGWQFIPVNPAGVLRAHKEQLKNEERGHWFRR